MTQITIRIDNPAQEERLLAFIAQEGLEVLPTAENIYESLQASVKEYKQYQKGELQPQNMQDFLTELRDI